MRKVLSTIIAVVILLASLAPVVNAATKDELIKYIEEPFTIAGKQVSIPSGYVKEAKRYINKYGITSQEADRVIAKINDGVALMDKAGVSDINALSKSQKQELLGIAQDAASVVGAKINYTQGGGLKVIAEDGTVFGTYQINSTKTGLFVQTGYDYLTYVVAGVIAIIAIASVVLYRKKSVNA